MLAIPAADVRDGDVLLFRGSGMVGWWIRRAGRGDYTHAGLATLLGSRGEPFVAEVREWYGGRIVTLASQLEKYPGRIDVYRPLRWIAGDAEPGHDHSERYQTLLASAVGMMRGFAGRRYGYWAVLQAGLMHTFLLRSLLPPSLEDAENGLQNPLFCSQAVALAFRSAGVDLVPNLADRLTEPSDLSRSSVLRLMGTVG